VRTTDALGATRQAHHGGGRLPVRTARVALAGRWLGPVFSARTWLAMVYMTTGLPLGLISFVLRWVALVFLQQSPGALVLGTARRT
jgi:hypothetical protein